MMDWLRQRTAKEILAFIALWGSIVGAAVLTLNRVWLIQILEKAQQWVAIADIAKIDSLIIGVVLIGLGLVINKRSAKVNTPVGSAEISGGE